MVDEEEAGSLAPASTSTRDHGFAPESRAGGHLIAFIRYQRRDHPPMVTCTCGATIRADTDELLVPAFTRHRRVEISSGRGQEMEKFRHGESDTYYRLEIKLPGSRPSKPRPADQVTALEVQRGYDRPPERRLDPRKLGGRLV